MWTCSRCQAKVNPDAEVCPVCRAAKAEPPARPDSSVHTTQLNHLLLRMKAGDQEARNELLRSVCGRLERLARKMLKGFPNVHRWAQTDDVMQSSLLRLLRALEKVQPNSMREFYGLAAQQIRRELLDLARHYGAERRQAMQHALPMEASDDANPGNEAADRAENPDEVDKWYRFHQAVERLPAEEREIVGLIFYHGWTQLQVAELFQVSERTVRRRWEAALVKLHDGLKEDEPA
jgi:RNA polymerase sigma-70 factor (ECF subfamily)